MICDNMVTVAGMLVLRLEDGVIFCGGNVEESRLEWLSLLLESAHVPAHGGDDQSIPNYI